MKEALLITQCIAIMLLSLETGYIFFKWKTKLQGFLFLICLSTVVNSVGYLLAIQSSTLNEYLIGLKMSYFGRVWIPFSLLLFVSALCKRNINRGLLTLLAFVHMSVFVAVATCEHHSLYSINMYLNTEGIFPCLGRDKGPLYIFYHYMIIVYMVYGISILVNAIIKEKNAIQKKRLLLVFAAIIADSMFYIIEMLGLTEGFDDTAIGYAISAVFMFVAIFKYSLLDTLKIVSDYVIDEVSEGVVVVDTQDKIEYANKPAKNIFPQIGNKSREIIESIQDSISTGEPLRVGEKIYTPEMRELEKDGLVIGTIYVLVDDTEHYHYMMELKKQKELAEDANASKSAFLSVVSHEIRTPMNAVVGMTDLLLRENDKLSDKQEKYLRNIKNSGSALVMIVNDILDQSKIEAGKMEIVEDIYELRPMIEDVNMIIENRIENKPIKLICEIDDEVPEFLVGDSLRIRQILINLLNNAVKFTEEGYIRLTINCIENDAKKMKLRFSVKDSGQGIRNEDLSKLGQAFAQVDTKRNHSKEGTGLGLSISRDFISMMGGQLEVASEYGKGTEFFFSIDQGVGGKKEAVDENGYVKQAWQEDVEFTAPGAHILIVDDTEINVMIMKECLSILEMEVDTALSGEEALSLIKQKQYDIIFMDYMMPYMDGVQTTEKIRGFSEDAMKNADNKGAQYYRNVPIIALTADSSDKTRDIFVKAGIDDFTYKPVDMKQLKEKMIKWLPAGVINYAKGNEYE